MIAAIDDELTSINSLVDRIVELNIDIRREVNLSRNPNDLIDRRQVLLNEFSEIVDASVRFDPSTQVARVEVGGRLLIADSSGVHLDSFVLEGGEPAVIAQTGELVEIDSGMLVPMSKWVRKFYPVFVNL